MAEEMNPSAVHTYHCLCTQVLLATTLDVFSLPRRATPALDKAIILPIPASPDEDHHTSDPQPIDVQASNGMDYGASILSSVTSDRRPTIIQREDGFEKRAVLRCGRCRLVVGYRLDETQYSNAAELVDSKGQKLDVVYFLPGSLVTTEDMKKGKLPDVEPWKAVKV